MCSDGDLMGKVARTAMAGGGTQPRRHPTHLLAHEKSRRYMSTLIITEDMHVRKKVSFMNSDAVVVLPAARDRWTNSSKC